MGAASVRCRRYCCAWVSSSLASSSHPPVDLGQRPILTGMASRNRLCASDDDILEPRKADRRGLRCSRHSAGFASLRPRPSVRGYTRTVGGKQIPYLVARAGGYYDPHLKPPNRRPPSPKIPRSGNDASGNPPGLEVYNDDTLGFLRLPVLPALVAGASVTLHPTSGKTGVGDRLIGRSAQDQGSASVPDCHRSRAHRNRRRCAALSANALSRASAVPTFSLPPQNQLCEKRDGPGNECQGQRVDDQWPARGAWGKAGTDRGL